MDETYGKSKQFQRKIFIKPFDRMVQDLISEMSSGKIILDPDYQRNYVWDDNKASLFVESILLNIPIPVIYASEDSEGKWIIVDGLQRLYSLKRFAENDFKLSNLETLSILNHLNYNDMSIELKNKFMSGELRVVLLQNDSDPNVQFDIFMRLNRGSVILNEQELRNCLYRGKLNDLIKELSVNGKVKSFFPMNKRRHIRMAINEAILRYFAISENYDSDNFHLKNYDGNMKSFLNKYMKNKQSPSDGELKKMKDRFLSQLEKCYLVFGEKPFALPNRPNKFSIALYDCTMITFEKYATYELVNSKQEIKKSLSTLMNDEEFINTISKSTNNPKNINYRLAKYGEIIKKVVTK